MRRTTRGGLVAVLAGLAAGGAARADDPAGLRIGMVQGMFRDVQPAMVQAMSRPLRDLIQRQTGLTGAVDVAPDALVIEVTGDHGKVQALLRMLEPYGIKEIAQSGLLAIGRGGPALAPS